MAIFRVVENEKITMSYVYEVEAETESEAIELYIEKLAGTLECINEYETTDEEGVSIEVD